MDASGSLGKHFVEEKGLVIKLASSFGVSHYGMYVFHHSSMRIYYLPSVRRALSQILRFINKQTSQNDSDCCNIFIKNSYSI